MLSVINGAKGPESRDGVDTLRNGKAFREVVGSVKRNGTSGDFPILMFVGDRKRDRRGRRRTV